MSIRLSYVARQDSNVKVNVIEDKKDFRIGSDSGCHVTLEDSQVSRCHAVLRCDSDKHFLSVEDISENGSIVNSRTVLRNRIRIPILFSVLQISDYLFWFSYMSTIPNGRKHSAIMEQHRRDVARASEINDGETDCDREAMVRYLLQMILPQENKLHAFCVDHFNQVQSQFGSGMTRSNKENILIGHENPESIVEKLQGAAATVEHKYILRCIRARWQEQNR